MSLKNNFCRALCLLIISSCTTKDPDFKILPTGQIKHQYIVTARHNNNILAKGFAGATPPNTQVYFEVGADYAQQKSAADGSFMLMLPDTHKQNSLGVFNFTLPDKTTISERYNIKNLNESLNLVAGNNLKAPPEISYVKIHNNKAIILSRDAALLRQVEILSDWTLREEKTINLLLNPEAKTNLSPQAFDIFEDQALLSFADTNELALIDLKLNKIINKKSFENPLARSPQQVLSLGENNYLVGFNNFDQKTQEIAGPGAVALVNLDNNTITLRHLIALPFKNPYVFKTDKNNQIWVSCTGKYLNKNTTETSDAGLARILISDNKNSLSINQQISFSNFTPARFELYNNTLIIPELWGKRLLILDTASTEIRPDNIYSAPHDAFFTEATYWHDDIIMLSDASGALLAYSLKDGFFAFPFVSPLSLSQDNQLKLAPEQLIMRFKNPDQDYVIGYSALIIASDPQNKIIPLDFLKIFGP